MAVPLPKGVDFGTNKRTRRTLVLAVVFVLYLIVGGVAFRYLEVYVQLTHVPQLHPAWRPLQDVLWSARGNSSESAAAAAAYNWTALKQAALDTCQSHALDAVDEQLEAARDLRDVSAARALLEAAVEQCGAAARWLEPRQTLVPWSFIDSVYFCMTVVTTIGYGHISPKSPGGQIFCIFYSLLGIPTSGLLLAGLSDFFAGNLLNFYNSKWQKRFGDSRWSLAAFTVIYLLVGFVLFVFVPAVVFTWLEDWNYRQAVYYAFITLSTIGFGDYTAAVASDDAWTSVYKVFVMVWVLVGLGYWVLVLNFLQKSLKSREVVATLKSTSRLIAKEAEDLRNVLSQAGILQREALFIPEHTKTALSLMLGMSSSLAGATQPSNPGVGAAVKGIHNIGGNLRTNSLLAALLAAMPPEATSDPAGPAGPAAVQPGRAQVAPAPVVPDTQLSRDRGGGGDLTGATMPPAEEDVTSEYGEINAGYLSDSTPDTSAATPAPIHALAARR